MTTHHSGAARAPRFADLQLHSDLLGVLQKNNFVTPTAIQHNAIPVALKREDIIGIAQTGTGKTLAFGLPILHRLLQSPAHKRFRSLIILPTRELAIQVDDTLRKLGAPFGLRSAVLIGGEPIRRQQQALRLNPQIIVATPGRLIDHLNTRSVDLRLVDTLVLDEADRMLDMGFAPQIKEVLRSVPTDRQTMLFSATMPSEIVQIARAYMKQPTRVEIARPGSTAKDISQELFILPQEEKNELLAKVLLEYQGTVLIFARTRSRAGRVARFAKKQDHSAAEIHSDRTLLQRRKALEGFKSGKYRILVATDIASRGIDVSNIELVINYDLPDCAEDYVHRIGRTGRAGKSGHAISFAAPDQGSMMRDIERIIRTNVAVSPHSTHQFSAAAIAHKNPRQSGRKKAVHGNAGRPSYGFAKKETSRGGARRGGSGRPGKKKPQENPSLEGGINPTDGGKAKYGLHYSNAGYTRSSSRRGKPAGSRNK